jgi:hypothetical protein
MWQNGQWLVTGLWFSTGTPVSSTNKTGRQNTTEILLKVALNPSLPSETSKSRGMLTFPVFSAVSRVWFYHQEHGDNQDS